MSAPRRCGSTVRRRAAPARIAAVIDVPLEVAPLVARYAATCNVDTLFYANVASTAPFSTPSASRRSFTRRISAQCTLQ